MRFYLLPVAFERAISRQTFCLADGFSGPQSFFEYAGELQQTLILYRIEDLLNPVNVR